MCASGPGRHRGRAHYWMLTVIAFESPEPGLRQGTETVATALTLAAPRARVSLDDAVPDYAGSWEEAASGNGDLCGACGLGAASKFK
jgi:hypothetical protein